ncbi:Thiol:disulfide interchange protein DsbD precursor [Sedimentisphaera cyanobacteriorum]|uniref:Thiol:disulfide interchange protein DsbD n=1 Tax=Sedimentisphaera cyanobacteriorum TaxID=1940790 RepID=A0A1Q2HRJ7_9BACT|nr:cytochrome c biogenesis protein CcdA [Sedimentisphaera cyanobacteriorum]AQQ10020.1 Thiol:disulfide interchange protein DsbD precursor [Sedimentisphaera cyanobacteriorum]
MKRYFAVLLLLLSGAIAQSVDVISYQGYTSRAGAELVQGSQGTLAVQVEFEGDEYIHYYADENTAPGGLTLSVALAGPELSAGGAVYPETSLYMDKQGKSYEVYEGDFSIYLPVKEKAANAGVDVIIKGIGCAGDTCLPPFEKTISAEPSDNPQTLDKALTGERGSKQTETEAEEPAQKAEPFELGEFLLYCLLALAAGLSFNVMPCVWPVLPIAVQRLVNFAGHGRKKLFEQGLAYSLGIISFFAIFAAAGIIIKLTTGNALNWSEHLRYPPVLVTTGMLLIVFALFMFDVLSFAVPSSLSGGGQKSSGGDLAGTTVMGFFAALLSTPCSGAILAAVFLWAQTQTLAVSTVIILLLGVGMAIPYFLLVNFPALLEKLPKPGAWMEKFRNAMGFLLLFIAVKLLVSLNAEMLSKALTYAVILSFAVWMFGSWVNFTTPKRKKMIVRGIAALIAAVPAFMIFSSGDKLIDWQPYSTAKIQQKTEQQTPVLIKFTADWCTNCHILDSQVFQDEKIASALEEKNVYPVLADTTLSSNPATEALKEEFGESGNVPLTVVISPDGERTKLRGIYSKKELLEVLNNFSKQQDG